MELPLQMQLLVVVRPHNPLRKAESKILVKETVASKVCVSISRLLNKWVAGKT